MDGAQHRRARQALLQLGWRHPFFLPLLARVRLVEDATAGTMYARADGEIHVDPAFSAPLPSAHLAGVLGHELCHLVLSHAQRRGSRDVARWNIACDMAINAALRADGIALPDSALYPSQGLETASAETIYDALPPSPPPRGRPRVGEGCGVESVPGASPTAGDAGGPDWRGVAAQCRAMARQAGSGKGDALARLVTPPPARVPWARVLRHALSHAAAAHGRQGRSFSRLSRRAPPGILLPGWVACRARVGIVIDTSGSMSDEELAQCVAESVALAREANNARVYLVAHDAAVQFAGWLDARHAPAVQRALKGRGGTDFAEAYEALSRAGTLDVAVHLTDGEIGGRWPDMPGTVRHAVAAILRDHAATRPPRMRTVEVTP